MDEEDLLDSLLAVATDQLENALESSTTIIDTKVDSNNTSKTPKKTLKDTDIFKFETNLNPAKKSLKGSSVIHSGDTDSSDDEGNRNYEDQKYNECGRVIKKLLIVDESANSISTSHYGVPKKRISTWTTNPNKASTSKSNPITPISKSSDPGREFQDVFLDPIFGMRIINPKISSSMLTEKMQGRLAVRFSDLTRQMFAGNLKDKDWVICGVVVNKSPPKTSQKGNEYSIWTLSDLKDDIKTVALFLFSSAHKDLWKTLVGSVIGVLNPTIMERKEGSKDEACLSVDTAQKLMVFGQSKDFGICKSLKKNGDKCTAIVNLRECEFCIYHIKQEYQKCSKRSELQANFAGKGLVNLRNKVLGKNEVFYAGKSYTAIPAKKSKKLEARDKNILQNLNSIIRESNGIVKAKKIVNKKKKGMARHLDVNPAQRARDIELLKKLGGATNLESKNNFSGIRSDEISLEDSKATALNVISKLKANKEKTEPKSEAQSSQYNLRGDLFVNVESKSTFSGKISEAVSLEDSRSTALSVISKLKANRTEAVPNTDNNEEGELLTLEEFETELNYSEDEVADIDGPSKILADSGGLKGDKSEEKRATSSICNALQKNTPAKQSDCKETVVTRTAREPLFNSPKPESKKLNFNSPKVNNGLSPKASKTQQNINLNNINVTPKSDLQEHSLDKMTMGVPMLSGFGKEGFIDLAKPITSRHVDRAKMNAVKYIQRTGPIKKIDPNSTKSSGTKKRNFESVLDKSTDNADNPEWKESSVKKSKLQESEFISDRFKKMMAMTSRHADLLELHDNQEKEKYFNKLEVKEKMEEKMVNTHKVKCKAVKCLQCKYTSFSASDFCKSERHPLRVCSKFDEIGSKFLSRAFIQLEKRHATIYKRVKSALPRRESERKNHALARHSDILQAVETRLSMLNMTYMRYIENRLICFIPGKVLDETKNILDLVESNKTPPRTHQLLQELRDLSSMAIEHFDEHILPRCREQLEQRSGSPEKILKELQVVAGSLTPFTKFQGIMYKNLASTSKQPARILIHQHPPQAWSKELYKVKKISKTHKHHITYLTQNTQKLCLKLRKQNNKLRLQAAKLRDQDRKLQEQNSKIVEQEAALTDIKKHMDEWDQKYKDLTTELVRARDEILLKTSSGTSPIISGGSSSFVPQFTSNIKPRAAHILPKSYLTIDLERKRKTPLNSELPVKRNRGPGAQVNKNIKDVSLNIPDLVNFEWSDAVKDADTKSESTGDSNSTSKETSAIISSFFDNLLSSSLKSDKTRKRKMMEDIDLK